MSKEMLRPPHIKKNVNYECVRIIGNPNQTLKNDKKDVPVTLSGGRSNFICVIVFFNECHIHLSVDIRAFVYDTYSVHKKNV